MCLQICVCMFGMGCDGVYVIVFVSVYVCVWWGLVGRDGEIVLFLCVGLGLGMRERAKEREKERYRDREIERERDRKSVCMCFG